MKNYVGILGIALLVLFSYIISSDRKRINFKRLGIILVVMFLIGYVSLNTEAGNYFMAAISNGFNVLMGEAADGVNFVFGGIVPPGGFCFFLSVLVPIIFISLLIGILKWTGILKWIITGVGYVVSIVTGYPKLESFNSVSSLILGQSESWIAIKDQLDLVEDKRMYTLAASAMSTISLSILGSYMQLLQPKFVVVAVLLNLFGAFFVLHLINPYTSTERADIKLDMGSDGENFFTMLGEYIVVGFKVAIMVGIMLVGFLALISLINHIFSMVFGISFQTCLGYIFAPIAYVMGVSNWHDATMAGTLMATKLISNEFVAMTNLKDGLASGAIVFIDPRSIAVISTFLVSFANFSSIGIIIGCVKALNEKKSEAVAVMGLKLLLGATMVSFLTAAVVGLVY